MTQDILNNLDIDIADYEKQVKIGKILNTIEIKIELNNHTNNNLFLYFYFISIRLNICKLKSSSTIKARRVR